MAPYILLTPPPTQLFQSHFFKTIFSRDATSMTGKLVKKKKKCLVENQIDTKARKQNSTVCYRAETIVEQSL